MSDNKEQVIRTAAIGSTREWSRSQIESVLYLLTGLKQERQRPLIRKSRLVQRRKAGSAKNAEMLSGKDRGPCDPGRNRTDLLLQAILEANATSAEGAMRHLSGQLISAQEAERRRIARELHDDLSQRMAILAVELQQLEYGIPKRKRVLHTCVHDLWAKAQEISAEINRLSYQLHPPKLEHLGLVAAVKGFCAEVSERQALNVEVCHPSFPAALPKDVALCAFRIVQESLDNVTRHSGARQARVVLTKTDYAVHLCVSDEGCGFDVESAGSRGGLGLLSMRERIWLVGGEFSVHSQPSRGTRISVSIPLARQA